MSSETTILSKLKNRYLSIRITEIVFFAVAVAMLSFTIAGIFFSSPAIQSLIGASSGVIILVVRIFGLKLHRFNELRVAIFLNQHYPELEASTDLLLSKKNLSTLEAIQKKNTYEKLNTLEKEIKLPNHLLFSLISVLVAVSVWWFASPWLPLVHDNNKIEGSLSQKSAIFKSASYTPVGINKLTAIISSPAYTRIPPVTSVNPNLKLIEGGAVKWEIQFSGEPINPSIVLSGKDTLVLKRENQAYILSRTFNEAAFYQIAWSDSSKKSHQTDFYSIEIIKDEAPHIAVENLSQFIELKLSDRLAVDLKANLTDDFGLSDAQIIATVSKGSGESVKFREEILRFSKPAKITGKHQQGTRTIDLVKLGLEPGDELYFYIEAFDNKLPKANKSRTETFFIDVQDTTTYAEVSDEGLGVDLMPEYFRSQRQIIIDSEKLLAERKANKIKKEDFNFRSNELGYDQKVLRLRYGQFMGEEFESGIVTDYVEESDNGGEKEAEDPLKKYGHEHDTKNEHNLVPDKKGATASTHKHDEKTKEEGEQENPLEAFAHNHDNTDEASFFIQTVRTKLKAALTLMWDAELHLRLYKPETSLPYQYKILKLLKEISNDSRVYVHRTGFDPPPIKEEKRLSGDLSEIKNSSEKNKNTKPEDYPAIRKGLLTIEALLGNQNAGLNTNDQTILQEAGNELAAVALKQPGTYLKSLSLLKSVINNEIEGNQLKPAFIQIRESFWNLLPAEAVSPSTKRGTQHALDSEFLQQLEEIKNEH
jgi:hypothetical protein